MSQNAEESTPSNELPSEQQQIQENPTGPPNLSLPLPGPPVSQGMLIE